MDQIVARRSQAIQLSIPAFTETAGRASTNPPSDPNRHRPRPTSPDAPASKIIS
jgi:hypothetical protein